MDLECLNGTILLGRGISKAQNPLRTVGYRLMVSDTMWFQTAWISVAER